MDERARPVTRPMRHDDVEAVCRLSRRVFHRVDEAPSAEMVAYWTRLLLDTPHHDVARGSLVRERPDGTIEAAITAQPMDFVACGRVLKGRLLSSFMADPDAGSSGGVLGLSLRARTQEFTFSDAALTFSSQMSAAAGAVMLPLLSLQWRLTFRPLGALAVRLEERWPRLARLGLRRIVVPFDALLARRFRPEAPPEGYAVRTASRDEFLDRAPQMVAHYAVHPAWSRAELGWILDMADVGRRERVLRLSAILDPKGEIVGLCAHRGERRGRALVLNILAREGAEAEVVPTVVAMLAAAGHTDARGGTVPKQIEQFFRMPRALFRHLWHAHVLTRHEDVREALRRGDVYMGGLAGEGWTLLTDDGP